VKKDYSFKANIRLKDLIGQGLINNSNIAIIELIKNARDAKSKDVSVTFENAKSKLSSSRIIIQDSGTGMTLDDIVNKWLNIAYSEKRDKGLFAGDKGIGRFSCDRLGKTLHLYTKKSNEDLVHLHVDWEKFEIDDRDKEISYVKFTPKAITQDDFKQKTGLPPFNRGTCLIIEDLREAWGKSELERLKKELERFIIDPEKSFSVYFKSIDFLEKDGSYIFDGKIENKLFVKLDEKTISVHSAIADKGKIIRTEIRHYGDIICSFEEANPYTELLDVKTQIHYLSQGSKISFKSITGYQSADYASIMFFFNGFRVMPYGEPKDDWLQLNQRKAQGTRRFLGTRDLFGIVEAYDSKRRLMPVTSREGMANTKAFKQLTDSDLSDQNNAYIPSVLRVLERYVVEGIDWDRAKPKEEGFSADEIRNAMQGVLEGHKKNKKLQNVKINYKKISEIAKQKVAEYEEFVEDLLERVSDKPVYELTPSEKQDVKKYIVRHDTALAQKTATNEEYKKTIDVEKKRRLFAESHLTSDTQRVQNLQHNIGNLNGEICDKLEEILRAESKGTPLSYEKILDLARISYFHAQKIRTLSEIITKANFDMMSETIPNNVFTYIKEYFTDMRENGAAWGLKITFENPGDKDLLLNFSPIEFSMILDNILSNAHKVGAKNINVKVTDNKKHFSIEFIDDGSGLSSKYNPEDYFKAGISTTRRGSGMGLSYIKQIIEDREGNISLAPNKDAGATLKIWWDK
jgi:signal transduction histidine kinase